MKIIVAPDKFKGSLTSMQACECIRDGILQADKNADIKIFPMADGGDGFADVMKYYLQTRRVQCKTVDPLMRNISASYELDATNKTAIIELAAASGLLLLKEEERNPLHTSTYGTGLLINHAIDNGAKKIILGIGGSATNDAGIGILAALGFVFKDEKDKTVKPVGENLSYIKSVTVPASLPAVEFIIACDVINILFGKEGAAFIYASQKGADEKAVQFLNEGLKHFASVIKAQTGKDIANFPGSGAAGGVAAGLAAYFNIQIESGAKLITAISGIEKHLQDADMIITGEGKLDYQSSKGKVIHQMVSIGKKHNIPVIALCGEVCINESEIKEMELYAAHSLINQNTSKEKAIKKAAALLQLAAASLFINKYKL